ncbi:MAG: 4-alpha-glucanotransferase [Simkaniaceae bacterium]|nr:MAG: 4-alpha-glucanotransferase [Simkaniaceae bacterium]
MNLIHSKAGKGWEKVGVKHHHGIQIPLLSIWTEKSCGNGEFLDLIPFINFLSGVGMDVLQLLPLNDSGTDPSPYNALSSTALHPIYLSLHALPHLNSPLPDFKVKTKRIPYWDILDRKLDFLKRYIHEVGNKITSEEGYQIFIETSPHLHNYALYKVLKDKNKSHIWQKWPDKIRNISKHERKVLGKELRGEMSFYLILQYLCHTQLEEVKKHAEKKGVFLKGDIPILLSPDSADVWAHQEFFNLSLSAGSPPNAFDPKGQLWKFPLYNWKVMEENHFEWWRKRIEVAAKYFHLYRIDHILGFFRIWAIPQGEKPDKGLFIPSEAPIMEIQGRKLLETLLSFSEMLPLGEDLGDPPPFVRETMKELGIPGTKIFRRYRKWKTDRSFIPYADYFPASISCVSTHDIETTQLWWERFPDEAKDYASFKGWSYEPKLPLEHLKDILYDNHHSGSFFHINLLQEYLALTPELTWGNLQDELINIPGTEDKFNWTYRYRFPLEKLLKSEKLKMEIQAILA